MTVLLFAILATSCSEDQFAKEENSNPLEENSFRKKGEDITQLIDQLSSSYPPPTSTVQQIIESVETEAFKINAFIEIAENGYRPVAESEIALLSTNSLSETIKATSYSEAVKYALEHIVSDQSSHSTLEDLQTNEEVELVKTCQKLFDTGDDNDRGVRTVAFAYGSQTSEANGVVIAAVMTILANRK